MSANLQFKYQVFLCPRGADIGQQYKRAVSFFFIVKGVGWESGHEKKKGKLHCYLSRCFSLCKPGNCRIRIFKEMHSVFSLQSGTCREQHCIFYVLDAKASFGFREGLASALYFCRKVRKDRNHLVSKRNIPFLSA